ncbi:Uncharacterised protein [uncultured archaeon]|nr:Uncharacterised protein [uncultured archaeon]
MKKCPGNYYLAKATTTKRRLKRTGNILRELAILATLGLKAQHWTPARRRLVTRAFRAAHRATV